MLIDKIAAMTPGTVIPKPESTNLYTYKGIVDRNGEPAVAFTIPRKNRAPETKWITESQLELAYKKLCSSGEIDTPWWNEHVFLAWTKVVAHLRVSVDF